MQYYEDKEEQDEHPSQRLSWTAPDLFAFPSLEPPDSSHHGYPRTQESVLSSDGGCFPSLPGLLYQEMQPSSSNPWSNDSFDGAPYQTSEYGYPSTEETTSPSMSLGWESQSWSLDGQGPRDLQLSEIPYHQYQSSYDDSHSILQERLCLSPTSSKAELDKTEDRDFTCTICSRVCDSSKSLRQHKRCHTKSNACPVQFCDARFTTKRDLERHKQTVHMKGGDKFHCMDCGTKFTREDNLLRHRKDKCPRRSGDEKELFTDLAPDL